MGALLPCDGDAYFGPRWAALKPLQKTLERHPAPWRTGQAHEAMCEILDANGTIVLRVQRNQFLGDGLWADDIAEGIVEAVNRAAVEEES